MSDFGLGLYFAHVEEKYHGENVAWVLVTDQVLLHAGTSLLVDGKLQALAYSILLPTTARIEYAIGLEKLSANGKFCIGAQMAVSL